MSVFGIDHDRARTVAVATVDAQLIEPSGSIGRVLVGIWPVIVLVLSIVGLVLAIACGSFCSMSAPSIR